MFLTLLTAHAVEHMKAEFLAVWDDLTLLLPQIYQEGFSFRDGKQKMVKVHL